MAGKGKAAQGAGSIRKKTVVRNGKEYVYWEARVTVGTDQGTGKQIQKSFTGKTQKEVREKLQAAAVDLTEGTYTEPSKLTLSAWLDIWYSEYLTGVKPLTKEKYANTIALYLKPGLGKMKLTAITPVTVQKFVNNLVSVKTGGALSAKSIKLIHGTLHAALEKAVNVGYIKTNPANRSELPKAVKPEIKPLDDDNIKAFLNHIVGHRFEIMYKVTLFTGMRESEVIGLTWDCIDFRAGTITVKQQLQRIKGSDGKCTFKLNTTKNGEWRTVTPAPYVMDLLKKQKAMQEEMHRTYSEYWNPESNYVFTSEIGEPISNVTLYSNFKKIAADIGIPSARFHDLRHSYAVAALRSGNDIKTVQEALGHHSAYFTLDTYAHVTEQMRKESADKMQHYIDSLTE